MAEQYTFRWEDDALVAALDTMNNEMDRAITAVMLYHAPLAEAYAKKNARWIDRSTNARNGLYARMERSGHTASRARWRIHVGHAVPYGIFLEVRFSGRYAIIEPTVKHEGTEVMKTLSGLFREMGW